MLGPHGEAGSPKQTHAGIHGAAARLLYGKCLTRLRATSTDQAGITVLVERWNVPQWSWGVLGLICITMRDEELLADMAMCTKEWKASDAKEWFQITEQQASDT